MIDLRLGVPQGYKTVKDLAMAKHDAASMELFCHSGLPHTMVAEQIFENAIKWSCDEQALQAFEYLVRAHRDKEVIPLLRISMVDREIEELLSKVDWQLSAYTGVAAVLRRVWKATPPWSEPRSFPLTFPKCIAFLAEHWRTVVDEGEANVTFELLMDWAWKESYSYSKVIEVALRTALKGNGLTGGTTLPRYVAAFDLAQGSGHSLPDPVRNILRVLTLSWAHGRGVGFGNDMRVALPTVCMSASAFTQAVTYLDQLKELDRDAGEFRHVLAHELSAIAVTFQHDRDLSLLVSITLEEGDEVDKAHRDAVFSEKRRYAQNRLREWSKSLSVQPSMLRLQLSQLAKDGKTLVNAHSAPV